MAGRLVAIAPTFASSQSAARGLLAEEAAPEQVSWSEGEPRRRRRIHQTPRLSDLTACRPWLEAELRADLKTVAAVSPDCS